MTILTAVAGRGWRGGRRHHPPEQPDERAPFGIDLPVAVAHHLAVWTVGSETGTQCRTCKPGPGIPVPLGPYTGTLLAERIFPVVFSALVG